MVALSESNLCRLCGCDNERNEVISDQEVIVVYKNTFITTKVSRLIDDNLNFGVDSEQNFPKKICSSCKKYLQVTAEFLNKVRMGQIAIQKLLDKSAISVYEKDIRLQCHTNANQKSKRGRPRKGFEKNTFSPTDLVHEKGEAKRKRKAPKHLDEFETSTIEQPQGKSVHESLSSAANTGEIRDENFIPETREQGEFMFRCSALTCEVLLRNKSELDSHQEITGHEGIITLSVFQPPFSQEKTHKEADNIQTLSSSYEKKSKSKGDFGVNSGDDSRNLEFQRDCTKPVSVPSQLSEVVLCDICYESFSSLASLQHHRSTGHQLKDERLYPCTECDRVFTASSSLTYHRDSVHRTVEYKCNIEGCNKAFKVANLLTRHLRSHRDERPFSCEVCHKSFKRYANMKAHMAIHKESDKTFCEVCGQAFKHSSSLKLHMKLHVGEKKFICTFCGKAFTQNGNLKEHMRIHTGEKPYKCSYCEKVFATSSQMKSHAKRHNGTKPHTCEQCFKRFLHKETLKIHMRRHSGTLPLVCPICQKKFSDASSLKKHTEAHERKSQHPCKVCGQVYNDESRLSNHMKSHNQGCDVKSTVWRILDDANHKSAKLVEGDGDGEELQHVIYIAYDDKPSDEASNLNVITKSDSQLVAPLSSIDPIPYNSDYLKDL